MSDAKYVKVISTLIGNRRNTGITHNFRNLMETGAFIDRLQTADLSKVKQIRIIPTEVTYTDPYSAASGLDGASGQDTW